MGTAFQDPPKVELGNQVLTVSLQIDAYTSDASAGPGSTPGPTEAGG